MLKTRLAASAVLYLLIQGMPFAALAGNEAEVYVGAESFTWREFDATGQLLKESGPRYEVGFTNEHEFSSHLTLKPRMEIFGGNVDYNGQACDIYGNCQPANTTTHYSGIKLEMDMGKRLRSSKAFILEPFGGLGLRSWSRSIDDSILADGSFATGYTENWETFYGRLGVRAEQYFSKKNKISVEAGVKLPISTSNYIDDRNVSYSSITLHPKNKPSVFAEVGVKVSWFRISAFYDTMRFKQSDVVYKYDPFVGGYIGYFQPKSESDMFGIRIGVAFY